MSISSDEDETEGEAKRKRLKLEDKEEGASQTLFLALDKCLPRRKFIEFIDIPDKQAGELEFDPEWLAITKALNPWFSRDSRPRSLPSQAESKE